MIVSTNALHPGLTVDVDETLYTVAKLTPVPGGVDVLLREVGTGENWNLNVAAADVNEPIWAVVDGDEDYEDEDDDHEI